MTAERILIHVYDTTADAKAAENVLLESGANKNMVFRSGKTLRVIATYEDRARELLGLGAATTAVGLDDPLVGSATASYGTDPLAAGGAASPSTETEDQGAVASATDTVQQATSTVTDAAQQAASTVTGQVSKATGAAADRVQSLADTVQQKGASPDAPAVQKTAAQSTATVLEKMAQYLRQPDVKVMAEDLRGTVRRYPFRALLVGFGVGYVARGTFSAGSASGAEGQAAQSSGEETPALDYSSASTTAYDTPASYPHPVGGDLSVDPLRTEPYVTDAAASSYTTELDPYGTDSLVAGAAPAVDTVPPAEQDTRLSSSTGTAYDLGTDTTREDPSSPPTRP